MKNRIKLLIILQFIYAIAVGQNYQSNVCTPKGSSVSALIISSEYSDTLKYYWDTYYTNAYPDAQIIKTNGRYSTTQKFNCHSFAWHVSDGGSNRWIGYYQGNTDEYIYWEDGSYIEISGYVPYPGKVSYASDDHSAITTSESGWFISKWGDKVLVKHRWNDCPYTSSNLKYYKLNFSISGPSLLCTTNQTYTLSNTPGGSICWGKSTNLDFDGSNSGQNVSIIPTSNGSGYVDVTFTSGCGTSFSLPQKNVWVGPPLVPTDIRFFPYSPCLNQDVIALVSSDNPEASGVHYEWRGGSHNYIDYSPSGSEVHFTTLPSFPYLTNVFVSSTNECGSSLEYSELLTVTDCGGGTPPVAEAIIYPNPASTEVEIMLEQEPSVNQLSGIGRTLDTGVYDVSICNISGNPVFKGKINGGKMRIPVTGWKKGVYVIQILKQDQVVSGTLTVN